MRGVRRTPIRLQPLRRVLVLAGLGSALLWTGCSPFYVIRAAYEESKILARRRDIDDVLRRDEATPEIRQKLRYVLAARHFSEQLGLEPNHSFTKYSHVDRDVLVWVLMAAPPDSFSMYTWWYPIVGTVPYKGYFERDDAEAAAASLERKGYETMIRGSEAFSTLGWFNDPILNTTLKHHETRIVNTVLHEIFHQTLWVPNHVAFNESAANFVGLYGAAHFFETFREDCTNTNFADWAAEFCGEIPEEYTASSMRAIAFEHELADVVERLYSELSELYASDREQVEKLERREEIFNRITLDFRQKYPTVSILNEVNNAEILQLKLYLTNLDLFRQLFVRTGSLPSFITELGQLMKDLDGKDPFERLRAALSYPLDAPTFPSEPAQ